MWMSALPLLPPAVLVLQCPTSLVPRAPWRRPVRRTRGCIFTCLLQNTANALERSDKDSNFASQRTLCGPLMANGVNNYKAPLR